MKGAGFAFVEDRFGNKNASCYLHGSDDSYLNLGTDMTLKPKAGSVSVWFKLDREIVSGRGYSLNPIVLTKCADRDDFFEAYCVYYDYVTQRIASGCTLDSTNQVNAHSPEKTYVNQWYHVVVTFDDEHLALYVNGEQTCKLKKNFTTEYSLLDSVVVGHSANKKNARYFNGCIDDISIYNKVLSPLEVSQLYFEPDPNKTNGLIKTILLILLIVVISISISAFIVWRIKKGIEKERKQNMLQQQLYEAEILAKRSQMDPHFIFNSLNTIQQFILANKNEEAYEYLSKFSKLIRMILESNNKGTLSLAQEIEILKRYIQIEKLRFDEQFAEHIEMDADLNINAIYIPQMLVQPFVENAIWHGLLPKNGTKNIWLRIKKHTEKTLLFEVEDDGVGRTRKADSLLNFNKGKSLAKELIRKRLELLSKQLNLKLGFEIIDKVNNNVNGGTVIRIIVPILKS